MGRGCRVEVEGWGKIGKGEVYFFCKVIEEILILINFWVFNSVFEFYWRKVLIIMIILGNKIINRIYF